MKNKYNFEKLILDSKAKLDPTQKKDLLLFFDTHPISDQVQNHFGNKQKSIKNILGEFVIKLLTSIAKNGLWKMVTCIYSSFDFLS